MTIDELRGRRDVMDHTANRHDYTSPLFTKPRIKRKRCAANDRADAKITVGEIVGDLFSLLFVKQLFNRKRSAHWWGSVIEKIFNSVW